MNVAYLAIQHLLWSVTVKSSKLSANCVLYVRWWSTRGRMNGRQDAQLVF